MLIFLKVSSSSLICNFHWVDTSFLKYIVFYFYFNSKWIHLVNMNKVKFSFPTFFSVLQRKL